MKKSAPQPRSRKTPRGGMKMARMILMMSLRDLSACRSLRPVRARVEVNDVGGDLPPGERHVCGCREIEE